MPKGINLGSGQRPFKSESDMEWINVDVQDRWSPDVVADGAHMPMFADNSIDVIVCSHSLEHFGLGEADSMIRECYRVLARGGWLIASTPDLMALAQAWLNGKIDDYIYCVQLFGAYMNDEADRHKWGMTQKTLIKTVACGLPWQSVSAFDWREIPGMDLANDWYIIGAIATK